MRATGEVDFIDGCKAETNRAKMPFHACARVSRPTDVVCAQVVHRVRKRSESSWPRIKPEINKAALEREEWPERPVAAYDFCPKQPMNHFEIAVCHRDRAACCQAVVGESLVEIVTHFSFMHDMRERLVAPACTETSHIRVCL